MANCIRWRWKAAASARSTCWGRQSGGDEALDFDLEYCDRAQILERLNTWMERHDPDVIIGWNMVQFDLRVLKEHADVIKCPCGWDAKASDGMARARRQAGTLFCAAAGRLIIDGIEALRSATWNFPLVQPGKRGADLWAKASPSTILPAHGRNRPAFPRTSPRWPATTSRIASWSRASSPRPAADLLLERASVTGLAGRPQRRLRGRLQPPLPLMHRQGYVAPNLGDVSGDNSPGGFVMDSQSGLYDSVLVLDYKACTRPSSALS
jgi:DNA polymerase-2